jgi:hypothetical protein
MLSSKALLVYLTISQWTGRKLDKRATGHVETDFKTSGKVGNYTKKLLPCARELEEISALAGAIRKFFYEQTLPWFSDGSRIISSKNYMDFVRQFQAKRLTFDAAVDAFLAQYPTLRDSARHSLGDLFSESEYPSTAHLKTAFQCEISFMPLPEVGDFRTEILDSEKDAFLARMRQVETVAMQDCWKRLHGVCTKAIEKLGQPEAIFRDSLIENIGEICALLPKLNIAEDPDLEAARQRVEALAASISPDTCRENPTERQDAASKLKQITESMSVFMGGAA